MKIIREYVERTIPADDSALRARLAQERERCAKKIEASQPPDTTPWDCADAIRALPDEVTP
jgi:hypothetical protein